MTTNIGENVLLLGSIQEFQQFSKLSDDIKVLTCFEKIIQRDVNGKQTTINVLSILQKITPKGSYLLLNIKFICYFHSNRMSVGVQFSNQKKASGGTLYYIHPFEKEFLYNIKQIKKTNNHYIFNVRVKNKPRNVIPKIVGFDRGRIEYRQLEEMKYRTWLANKIGYEKIMSMKEFSILLTPDRGSMKGSESTIIFCTATPIQNFKKVWYSNIFLLFGAVSKEYDNHQTFKSRISPLFKYDNYNQRQKYYYYFRCGVPPTIIPRVVDVNLVFLESGNPKILGDKDLILGSGNFTYIVHHSYLPVYHIPLNRHTETKNVQFQSTNSKSDIMDTSN